MFTRRQVLAVGASLAAARFGFATGSGGWAPVRRILFVHGRGQGGLDPTTIKREWLDALRAGAASAGAALPDGLTIDLPFYGDRLDQFASRSGIPLTSDINARGAQTDELLVFQAEIADAIRTQAGVTNEQVAAEYGDDPTPRGPLNWKWVQAILRAIDKHGGGLNQSSIELFTRDVFLYTTRPGVQAEIDRIVGNALTTQPTLVVAHSLGTVVSYNVLRTDRRTLTVPLFLTIGSPLGVRAIRDQFIPLRMPTGVRAWYNALDPRDVVPLYPLDAQNFPITPSIENNASVRNETSNRHGAVGYLKDPAVAKRIVQALDAS